jgi:hypothetical protein
MHSPHRQELLQVWVPPSVQLCWLPATQTPLWLVQLDHWQAVEQYCVPHMPQACVAPG